MVLKNPIYQNALFYSTVDKKITDLEFKKNRLNISETLRIEKKSKSPVILFFNKSLQK